MRSFKHSRFLTTEALMSVVAAHVCNLGDDVSRPEAAGLSKRSNGVDATWPEAFSDSWSELLSRPPPQRAGVRSGFQLGISDDYHEFEAPPVGWPCCLRFLSPYAHFRAGVVTEGVQVALPMVLEV